MEDLWQVETAADGGTDWWNESVLNGSFFRSNELVITAVHGGLPLLKWIFLDLTWFVTGGAIELPIVILIEFCLRGSRLVLVLACIHNTENKTKGNDHAYNSDADHGSSILI